MRPSPDELVIAHRMVAVVLYATAVHLAREHGVANARVWHAADRLRDEDLRGLQEQALRYQSFFAPRPGEFDVRSPGAVALETGIVSGARLACDGCPALR